jgi:zinc protease
MRLFWVFLATGFAIPLFGQQFTVSASTLSNGMKVLVHEDHRIPSVAMYFFFKVGSRNERPGTTGVSHFFEHMMFNGAKKYGPKQFDVQMEKNGGRNNASTGPDLTTYTDWFPATALELMFDMESDRIRDLAFDPKIVESERGVVYSERRTAIDNNPFGVLFEQLTAAAFVAHPYHWPVVGWASDIESWTMDDLKAHFKMGYAPNNCVLVITGDVTQEQVQSLARKYLEPIPRQEGPPPVRTKEPEQLGERRVVIERPTELPIVGVAYHVPPTNHADEPALDLLAAVLSNGRTSRLYKRLVDDGQLATEVNMFNQPSLDPGLLFAILQVRQGVDPGKVEKAMFEEVDRVAHDGVTTAELSKARNQRLVALYENFKTIAGKADLIGTYEVYYGDYRKLMTAAQDLEKVTAADVQRVAAKYLSAKNRTVATLISGPEPSKESAGKESSQ